MRLTLLIWLQKQFINLIACSRRRHGQDKTVLSCPCRRCEQKWQQYCLVSIQFPISKFSVVLDIFETEQLQIGNWVDTKQNCLVLSPILFTPQTRTRQDKTVLSSLCRRCEIGIKVLHSVILVLPVSFNFWHSGALALSPEHQSTRMSKNDGLDQYDAEPFEQQQFGTAGVEGVNLIVTRSGISR